MRESKTLKPKKFRWQIENEAQTFFKNLIYQFQRFCIWPITDNYRITKERLIRSLQYARFGWFNYDFDMAYVYYLFEFKLKRLLKCLENGHAIQKPEDMKALRELIKIVRRLGMGRYDHKYHILHDKKWGKIESKTTPNYNDEGKVTTYTWHSWRSGTKDVNEKVKKQERKEYRALYQNAEKDRVKDIERMAELIKTNSLSWWD